MSEIPKFVVVEGVDGSGKTTLVERFREDGSFKAMRTPTKQFSPFRGEMDNKKVSLDSRYSYFLATTMHANELVKQEFRKFEEGKREDIKDMVMDRYVSSTIVYHQLRAQDEGLDRDYLDITSQFDILKPDLVLLLTGDIEQMAERVVEEGEERVVEEEKEGERLNPYEEKAEELKPVDKIYKEVIGGYNTKIKEINVTSLDKGETFERALDYVNELDKSEEDLYETLDLEGEL